MIRVRKLKPPPLLKTARMGHLAKPDSNIFHVPLRSMLEAPQCMCPRATSIISSGGGRGFQTQQAKQDGTDLSDSTL
jgi:hypothetical protein